MKNGQIKTREQLVEECAALAIAHWNNYSILPLSDFLQSEILLELDDILPLQAKLRMSSDDEVGDVIQ